MIGRIARPSGMFIFRIFFAIGNPSPQSSNNGRIIIGFIGTEMTGLHGALGVNAEFFFLFLLKVREKES